MEIVVGPHVLAVDLAEKNGIATHPRGKVTRIIAQVVMEGVEVEVGAEGVVIPLEEFLMAKVEGVDHLRGITENRVEEGVTNRVEVEAQLEAEVAAKGSTVRV